MLVAPWINPDKEVDTDFHDYKINPGIVSQTQGIVIFNSDDDHESVQETVKILRESVNNIQYREFHNYGHFNLSVMGTVEFPELRDHLLEK